MKKVAEREIKVGLVKSAKTVVDEIEQTTAEMIRDGWQLTGTSSDKTLGSVFLFFEKDIIE